MRVDRSDFAEGTRGAMTDRRIYLDYNATAPCRAETASGNELALTFATAENMRQTEIRKEAVGRQYFFRYLRITAVERGGTNGPAFARMATVEPSSDMVVQFVITKEESLKRAEPLQTGDAVAVTGRLKSIDKPSNRIVLDPVIVRYKDRTAPKRSKELLYELDPDARQGTDTSTGKERVIK